MTRIRVTIDRLALHGVDPHDAKVLVESLRTHLSEVLSDRAMRSQPARSHYTPTLKLGRVPLVPGSAGARKFGKSMARAMGKGLK